MIDAPAGGRERDAFEVNGGFVVFQARQLLSRLYAIDYHIWV
jgi:hypothetical protein